MAQPADLIGKRIDNYTIQEFLARGGMADVYLARHGGLQRDVVLKILLPSYVENPSFVERFRREAQAMARLQHTHIVQVFDTGDTPDGRPYIAMQYVRGGTLEALLARLETQGQVMTVPYALAVTRQVAAALQAAHAAGIVHRDLKPSNILLDESGRPLLTDLGIAFMQDTQRLTRTDTFLGTPHYMSPEQGKGAPLDVRSDIYSLGVVLFEMLAGTRPFRGDSHWALIHQHITEPPPSLAAARPGVSKATATVVARCLEKDPGRRYQSAIELAAALDRALAAEGSAGAVTASGQWQWSPRPSGGLYVSREGRVRTLAPATRRGGRGRLWAGLGALALVALAAVWFLTRNGAAPAPPTATGDGAITESPATAVIVEVTREITVQPPAATSTPAVTAAEPTPVETPAPPTPSDTPPAPVSPEPGGPPTVQVINSVLTRSGPGTAYPINGSLARDAVVQVWGRDGGRNWYLVETPTGARVWVSVGFLAVDSDALESVEVAATIPALPTATRPAATPAPPPPPGPSPTSPPDNGGEAPPGPTSPPPTNTVVPPPPTNTVVGTPYP